MTFLYKYIFLVEATSSFKAFTNNIINMYFNNFRVSKDA